MTNKINKMDIDGSNNFVMQDIVCQTININSEANVDAFIKEMNNLFKETITIIIVGNTIDKVEQLDNLPENVEVKKLYGETIEDWKPFGGKTIINLLHECSSVTNINLRTYSFNSTDLSENFIASIKYIKTKTILIIDDIALQFPDNKRIIEVFNDFHVGGCIAVSPIKIPKIEKIKSEIFNHLHIYLNDMKLPDITTHIESINKIEKEQELFNALRNRILELEKQTLIVGRYRSKLNQDDIAI